MTKNKNTQEDIFAKGCLVQLNTSIWGASKRIDKKKAEAALGSNWAKAAKALVDPVTLKEVWGARNKGKAILENMSLPFPIKGIYFVPYELVESLDRKLQGVKEEFEDSCDKFFTEYATYSKQAEEVLGELYNEDDYPVNIKAKFGMDWKFVTISNPGENKYLSPDLVAREQKKFKETMEDARAMAVTALRVEFQKLVQRAVDRLTLDENGDKKIFHAATMKDNFLEFFDSFDSRNVFDDKEMKKIISKAKKIVSGVDPEELRYDDDLRESIKEEMSKVAIEVDKAVVSAPTRKINFED